MRLVTLPHPNKLIAIEPLDYKNTYDFNRPHCHNYFEVMLIAEGSGLQFIDFTKYQMNPLDVFTIYPGQIHLLQRNTANGIVIQFKKEIFNFLFPLKHHQFYFSAPKLNVESTSFLHLLDLTTTIHQLLQEENLSALAKEKAYSYLKVILITLTEEHGHTTLGTDENNFASNFLTLLEQHISTKKKVNEYAELLNLSTAKFTTLCKDNFGKTPLKLIHEELLMEIRRMILLDNFTLKEIAFQLNFDSQANFSAFIKQITGITATELQAEINKTYQ